MPSDQISREGPSSRIEQECWAGGKLLAAIDEAGYGSPGGSMMVSGVVFPQGFDFAELPGLNDSKKLSDEKRMALEPLIKQKALWWFCAEATAAQIDAGSGYDDERKRERALANKTTVYWLRFKLAEDYIEQHSPIRGDKLITLMDGNKALRLGGFENRCLVKGDSHCYSVAAASILSKCAKNRQMVELHKEFPQYGWADNKGYPNPFHIAAIEKFGLTPHHRRSYCKNIKIGE